LPDNSSSSKETAKITYRTDERDLLRKLANKYKCSPFTGECYIQEVSLQKIKKFYHIILTEEQMKELNEDYVVEEKDGPRIHQFLLMIKPTSEDNNYIFFRRK
jgi:hypothetical protein